MSLWIKENGVDGMYGFGENDVGVCLASWQISQSNVKEFLLLNKDGTKCFKYEKLG